MKRTITHSFTCFQSPKFIHNCCASLVLLFMACFGTSLVAQPDVDFYQNNDYCTVCSDTTYWELDNDGRDTIWYEACDEPEPLDNPYNLVCQDLRVLIIIDRSYSIVQYGAVDDVKEGVMAFIGGLSCPDVKTAVLDFSTQARWIQRNYESTPTTQSRMESYFQNEFSPDGNTNWNHAFYLANEIETPDLVLFFTDGNPTNWGWDNSWYYRTDACGHSGTTQPPEIINAIVEANILKSKGAHIFGMGVGPELEVDKLMKVTGPTELNLNDPSDNLFNTDWHHGNFKDLADQLGNLVGRTCASITCEMDTPACADANNGSVKVRVTVPGNYQYVVKKNGQTVTNGSAFGDSNNEFVIDGLPSGDLDISVFIEDADCPLTATCETTVTTLYCDVTAHKNVTCNGGSDGSITIDGKDGTGNYEYSIDGTNWQSGSTFSGLSAGYYTVFVREKDGNHCESTCNVTITEPPAVTCSIEADGILNCSREEVRLTLTVKNAVGNKTYNWTGPNGFVSTDEHPLVKDAGEYTVTVTDGNGCTSSCSIGVGENFDEPDCAIEDAQVLTCVLTEITLKGSSTTEGVTYSWRTEDGHIVSGGNSAQPVIDEPGTYTLTVTRDDNGCTSTCNVIVDQDITPPDCNITGGGTLTCENPQITLTGSSTTEGVTYSWSTASGNIVGEADQAEINVNEPGIYTLTVTRDDNGCTSTCNVTVDGNAELPSCSIEGGVLDCNTNSFTLVLTTDAEDPVFLWTGPGTFTSTEQNPNITAPGVYEVTVTNGVTGCKSQCSIEIEKDDKAPTCEATGGEINCNDESVQLNVVTNARQASFSWTGPGGFTSTDQNPTVDVPGVYTVIVTDGVNGCTSTCTATVTEDKNEPDCDAGISETLTCENPQITLQGSSTTDGATFFWTTEDGHIVSGGNTAEPVVDKKGTYKLTVTAPNGCTSTCEVEIFGDTEVPICTAVGGILNCDVTYVELDVETDIDNVSYSWSGPDGFSSSERKPRVTKPGTYTVTVTNKDNGCTSVCDAVVTEPDPMSCNINLVKEISGHGVNDGEIEVTATGGLGAYLYSIDGGATWQSSGIFTGLGSGTHVVTVKDEHECSTTCQITLGQPGELLCDITVNNHVSCFGGNDGKITVTTTGGVPPVSFSLNSGTPQSSGEFTGLSAGTYMVTVEDANGNTSDCQVTITEPDPLELLCVSGTLLCNGDNDGILSVTATGGTAPFSYAWVDASNPDVVLGTESQIGGLSAGSYIVTVIDAKGCESSCEASVTEPAPLDMTVEVDAVLCFEGDDGVITAVATGGVGEYEYSIDGGTTWQTSGEFGGLSEGTYTILVKDGNDCQLASEQINVEEPELLTCNIGLTSPVTGSGLANGEIEVTATGGVGEYEYSIDGGTTWQSSGEFTGLGAGEYTVTVRDGNECTSTCHITLGQPEELLCDITVNNHVSCFGGNDGKITVTATGGVLPISFSLNGGTPQFSGEFTGLSEGTYVVTVEDANGNTSNCQVTITEPDPLELLCVSGTLLCNGDNNGILSVTATGGTAPFSYAWVDASNPDVVLGTESQIGGLSAGSYVVTVIDAKGCESSCEASVTEPVPLDMTVEVDAVLCFEGDDGVITAVATGGVGEYEYSIDGGTTWQTSGEFGGLSEGTYTILVKDGNDCQLASEQINVEEPELLACNIQLTSPVTGNGLTNGEIEVTATGGVGEYEYSIDGGTTWQSSGEFTGLGAGEYTVTVRDGHECTSTCQITLGQPEELLCEITVNNHVSCFGGNDGKITVTATGGVPPISFSLNGGTPQFSGEFTGLSEGTYVVTVEDANGNTSNCQVTITEPDPPTVECPADKEMASCLTQDEIDAAFSEWIALFTSSCECTLMEEADLSQYSAPDLCGGEVTVTYYVVDFCENRAECTATFTVNPPDELEVYSPEDYFAGSCESQEDVNSMFASWLASFSYEGGCDPVFTDLGDLIAPDVCAGDTLTVTYTVQDHCQGPITRTAQFGVEKAPELTVTCSDPVYIGSCTSQAEIDAAFAAWISGFGYDGGCGVQVTDLSGLTAPDWCGGDTIVVTYIATDACGQEVSCESAFGVERTPELMVTCSDPVYMGSCTSQAEIDAAFAAWISGFGYDGGCGVEATDLSGLTAPDWCAGDTIVVTYTATDACGQEVSCESAFGVERTPELTVTCSDPVYIGSCTSQAEIDAAFAAWISGFGFDGGCSAEATDLGGLTAPDWCIGDTIVVTYIATDACGQEVSCESAFGVERTPELTVTCSDPVYIGSCTSQAEIDAAFAAWISGFGFDGGCSAEATDLSGLTAPDWCMGDTIVVTYIATDACGQEVSCESAFGVERTPELVILCPEDITLDECARQEEIDSVFADWIGRFSFTGGCSVEATDLSGYVAPDQCTDGSVTVTYRVWDACGQEAVCTATFRTIRDSEPPVIIVDAYRQVPCCTGTSQQFDDPVIYDNCDTDLDIQVKTEYYVGGVYECQHRRTWTVTDACGNVSTATQIVEIIDQTAPVLIPVHPALEGLADGDTLYLDCDEKISLNRDAFALEEDCTQCPQRIQIQMDQYVKEGDGQSLSERTVWWWATDKYGNTTRFTLHVARQDKTGPVFTSVPRNKVISCGESVEFGKPAVEDKCSGVAELSFEDREYIDGEGDTVYERTWTATDYSGNSSRVTQRITRKGGVPVFTRIPDDKTVAAGAEIQFGEPVASADCGEATVEQFGEDEMTGDYCSGRTHTRTWVARGENGEEAFVSQTITEEADTEAPKFSYSPGNIILPCGAEIPEYNIRVSDNTNNGVKVSVKMVTEGEGCDQVIVRTWTATDKCGNTASVSQEIRFDEMMVISFEEVPADIEINIGDDLPADMAIAVSNCEEGEVQVTMNDEVIKEEECRQVIERTFVATDGCGETVSAVQVITLTDQEKPSVIDLPEPKTIYCGEEVVFDEPEFADNVGVETVTHEDEVVEDGCAGGYYKRTWTATDLCGNVTEVSQKITILPDEQAPVFAASDTTIMIGCGDEIPAFEPVVTDDCSEDVEITVEDTEEGEGCDYKTVRTWTATDACGNTSTLVWEILRRDETAPEFDHTPEDYTVLCAHEAAFDEMTATDDCDTAVTITFADLQGEGDCFTGYEMVRTWTATDACGNEAQIDQRIFVMGDTTAPVFTYIPADTVIACGEELPEQTAIAEDDCAVDTLIVRLDRRPVNVDSCDSEGYYVVRQWIAEDACGNSDTATQYIAVLGEGQSSLLAFINVPRTKIVECEEEAGFDVPLAMSTCGSVEISSRDFTVGEPCSAEYKKVREWIAADTCGNTVSTYQTVLIRQDTMAPVLSLEQPVKYLHCGEDSVLTFDQPIIESQCGTTLLKVENSIEFEVEDADSVRIRTWTYRNQCGKQASISQKLMYGTAGGGVVFKGITDTLEIDCMSAIEDYLPEIQSCDPVSIEFEDTVTDSVCLNQLTLTRTWTVTPDSGEVESYVQTFILYDSIAPVIEIASDTMYMSRLEYETNGAFQNVISIRDNCDGTLTEDVTITDLEVDGKPAYEYEIVVEDVCGNRSVAHFTVVVSESPVAVSLDLKGRVIRARVQGGAAPYKYEWSYAGAVADQWSELPETSNELDISNLGLVNKVRVRVVDERNQFDETSFRLENVKVVQKGSVSLRPNPAREYVELRMDIENANLIEIYNTWGQRVKVYKMDPMQKMTDVHLDIREIPQGSYTIRIMSDQEVYTRQLIKMN